MTEVMIEAVNVTKTFQISAGAFRGKRALHAVNGVNLTVNRGDVVALVGESGCGKTTLAKMLLGLELQTSGKIDIQGKPVDQLGRLEIASLLQPIFQDPYSSLNPRKPIGSIITLPLKVQGDPNPATWRNRVEEMMELVGLPSRVFQNYPSQLSGGQRQRVAIARALINRPQVVICDEPTSALVVSVQSQILNLLHDLRNELKLTYIIISHNLDVVEHIATRVAVMYLGKIVELSDRDALYANPSHPYTRALLSAVPVPDPGSKKQRIVLEGDVPNPADTPPGCPFHTRCPERQETCSRVVPELQEIEPGHHVACLLRYSAQRQTELGISTAPKEDQQETTIS